MRPIQWHLKRHWRDHESLEKEIPVPRTLHPHLQWWTKEENVLPGQPLHPLHHTIQVYTCLKRRLACSLRRLHSKWHLVSSRKLITHKLSGIKSCFIGPKRFQHIVQGHIVLVATDNCSIHKQGGRYEVRLTLCPSMATPVLVQSETYCPKGQAHPRPSECDCGQTVPARSNNPDRMVLSSGVRPPVPNMPQVDIFATRYNCKLDKFVSPVPDPKDWAVDALTVPWEDLDMYAFPPVSLRGKVISKLSDHQSKRVILIAPGWPNMPWFWDLVDLSSQIPICLPYHPDLVTQPFNGACHRDLTSLNHHAWLLEPRQSRSMGSLAQWQYE